ncbi:hypothetical protein JCM3774_005675, partial [Rhodotorula dairenensis]
MVNATPDNANPTIHSSVRTSSARRVRVADLDLSADDDLAWESLGQHLEHEALELERDRATRVSHHQPAPADEIDADEIY